MEIGWLELLTMCLAVALAMVLYLRYEREREAKEAKKAEEVKKTRLGDLVEEYCTDLTPPETWAFLSLWRVYQGTDSDEEYEVLLAEVGDRVETAFQVLLDDETGKRGPFSED